SDNEGKSIVIKSLDEITKNKVTEYTLYESKSEFNKLWLVIIAPLALIFLFFYKKSKTNNKLLNNTLVYRPNENKFFINNKPLNLEAKLHSLLYYLMNEQDNYILLDGINELFASPNMQESYITINKRRDMAIKKLKYIISLQLNKNENEIIIERKNENDKRVKEIKLGVFIDRIE
ncbi:MAG: hypothetical protein KC469_07285, partial [Flavobacteriaceae bacterium]|nr:hypothetical protein [Flavobacteriaceae bacterium]